MEYATTPAWLKESRSAVRRAPSADLQATGGLGFKRSPLKSLNGCTRKVASRVMSADLSHREANRMFDSIESGAEPTITLEAKAWLTSLSCRKAKELGYPHELWTTRLLARHAREHGPAEGHPCLANTKMAVARVAAPDWSCAGSRGGGANPRHRASGCRRHTAGLRHRACASAGH
jgi:hypothetical protein